MKTMCPPGYYHNRFVATHALGHIYIYNDLENFLENTPGGVLEKFINKNLDPVKLELYIQQLYWKLTAIPAFFQDKLQLSILVLYIC